MTDTAENTPPRETRIVHEHHYRGGSLLGGLLVLFGALYLLRDLNMIPYFSLGNLLHFGWPVLLIMIGIAIIQRGVWATVLEVLVIVLVIAFFLSPRGRAIYDRISGSVQYQNPNFPQGR